MRHRTHLDFDSLGARTLLSAIHPATVMGRVNLATDSPPRNPEPVRAHPFPEPPPESGQVWPAVAYLLAGVPLPIPKPPVPPGNQPPEPVPGSGPVEPATGRCQYGDPPPNPEPPPPPGLPLPPPPPGPGPVGPAIVVYAMAGSHCPWATIGQSQRV